MNCYEVDNEGTIIEYLFLDMGEVEKAREAGRLIITKTWEGQRLFTPKWDSESNAWVEGLTVNEVLEAEDAIKRQQEKVADQDLNAIAIMELTELLMGGV